jgi:hypothetical protein
MEEAEGERERDRGERLIHTKEIADLWGVGVPRVRQIINEFAERDALPRDSLQTASGYYVPRSWVAAQIEPLSASQKLRKRRRNLRRLALERLESWGEKQEAEFVEQRRLGDEARKLRHQARKANQGAGAPVKPGPLRVVRVIECSRRSVGFVELALHWIYDQKRVSRAEVFEADIVPAPGSLRTAGDVVRLFATCGGSAIEGEQQ